MGVGLRIFIRGHGALDANPSSFLDCSVYWKVGYNTSLQCL